jgi:hypothetical protein
MAKELFCSRYRQAQGGKHNMGVDSDEMEGWESVDLRLKELWIAKTNDG